jgi:hypothetical protein
MSAIVRLIRTRSSRRVVAMLMGASLALVSAVPTAPAAAATCDLVSHDWIATASTDPVLTERFSTYGNESKGWLGADSTYSVPLPDNRRAWLFSDTFLGKVNDDGTIPADAPFVNSSFVIADDGSLVKTVTGSVRGEPTGLLPPPDANSWYWLGAGHLTRDGSSLDVMFLRFDRFGPGAWDWAFTSNTLGRFDPKTFRLREAVPLVRETNINWGSWIQPLGHHTLIYGVEDRGNVKSMHIARVAGDDLTQPWEYWTGVAWSPLETASAPVMAGVANEYSVTPFQDGYLLVTHDTTQPFSAEIVGYVSCSPTGPFAPIGLLYKTPETGTFGSYGNPNIITYNAHEHPDLRGDDATLLVTYNVNSLDWRELYGDATIYRPRFIRLTLTPADPLPTP